MKLTFKRAFYILFLTTSLSIFTTENKHTIETQLTEMHIKIQALHHGFELIFLKGEKDGHHVLSQIQEINTITDQSPAGKKLNVLVQELNAIFKTVRHIVKKYSGQGKHVLAKFIFDISRSCNLEELFKKTISELEALLFMNDNSVNNTDSYIEKLNLFIAFLKKIQPIWAKALANKVLIIENLRNSL